jgi:hypothetical protein
MAFRGGFQSTQRIPIFHEVLDLFEGKTSAVRREIGIHFFQGSRGKYEPGFSAEELPREASGRDFGGSFIPVGPLHDSAQKCVSRQSTNNYTWWKTIYQNVLRGCSSELEEPRDSRGCLATP